MTVVTFLYNRKIIFTDTGSQEILKMIQMRASEVATECLMQSWTCGSRADVVPESV